VNTPELLQHLEKLSGFAVVARLGGFHKAARELGISQPGLSRSIEALESIVGKKLLIRSVKGVRLTEEGKMILAFFEKIEASAGDLTQKIKAGNLPLAGEIRVASYETLCTYFWPAFLRFFEKKYPHLKIILLTANENEHWNNLVAGSIDVVVDAEPRVDKAWDSYVLYVDKFNFFAAKNFESKKDALNLISVEKASDENGFTIRDHCIKSGIRFYESFKLDTFLSVKAFVLEGLGVGVMPERLAREDLEKGRLKIISVKGISEKGFGKHRICFSTLSQSAGDSRISLLKKELKDFLAL
jgi:DNA-binding transcriptional LysR family regulator